MDGGLVTGHDFSHAEKGPKIGWALAPGSSGIPLLPLHPPFSRTSDHDLSDPQGYAFQNASGLRTQPIPAATSENSGQR